MLATRDSFFVENLVADFLNNIIEYNNSDSKNTT